MSENFNHGIWIELREADLRYFGKVEDRFTMGTARSNPLMIRSQKHSALLGQFYRRDEKWIYRDFQTRQSKILNLEEEFSVSDLCLKISDFRSFWQRHGANLQKEFRSLIAENPLASRDWILNHLRSRRFLNSNIPDEVMELLRGVQNELDLVGPIERLLEDPEITDILVESHERIYIEKNGEMKNSDLRFSDQDTYRVYIESLLSRAKKVVDDSKPFVDFQLPNGERAHLVVPPISSKHSYLSIRKPSRTIWSLADLKDKEMLSDSEGQLLQSLLRQRLNLLVSGATGSGKTTLLRALLLEIPASERLVIMEDVPELQIGRANAAYLCTRSEAQSLLPDIELRELVRQSLRMRPDRLVMGEVRGAEALDLLLALNTGHMGSLGSLHANSSRDALWRLHTLVKLAKSNIDELSVRELIHRNIHGIIHLGRDASGKRRILEIAIVRGVEASCFLLEYLVQNQDLNLKQFADSARASKWASKAAPVRLK